MQSVSLGPIQQTPARVTLKRCEHVLTNGQVRLGPIQMASNSPIPPPMKPLQSQAWQPPHT
jgi:hypothetical protein